MGLMEGRSYGGFWVFIKPNSKEPGHPVALQTHSKLTNSDF